MIKENKIGKRKKVVEFKITEAPAIVGSEACLNPEFEKEIGSTRAVSEELPVYRMNRDNKRKTS